MSQSSDDKISLIIALAVAAVALVSMRSRGAHAHGSIARAALESGRGRFAKDPKAIPARGWKDILVRVWKSLDEDRVLAIAAGVTFFGLLAIFPAIAALVSLYSLVADPADITRTLESLAGLLPGGAIDVIKEQLTRIAAQPKSALGIGVLVALGIALWSANSGMKAIFDALNVVYDEKEKRGFVKLNLISLTFTIGAVLAVLIAIGVIVAVPLVLKYLPMQSVIEQVLNIGRWPALFVCVVLGLSALYRYGPSRDKARWRWVTWGSAFAASVWLGASALFSWYAANFGSYNETYGSLGAVIGFMTWLWISAVVVLLGAEINAETEHQTMRDSTEGTPMPIGVRGAKMADTVGAAQS